MKTPTIFKKAALALSTVAAALLFGSAVASAIPYTGPNTPSSPTPAFNVYTGVDQGVGNESDFFRGRVDTRANGSQVPYVDPLNASCEDGQKLQLRVYVHNGASEQGNNNGTGPSVAHDTKVRIGIPSAELSSFSAGATISSSNAGAVNDRLQITCNDRTQTVKLKYVAGSATQYSKATGVVALPDTIVTDGALIRSHDKPGDVYGCWDQRVYVLVTVEIEKVEKPEPKTPVLVCVIDNSKFTFDNRTRKVSVTIVPRVENATVTGYRIDWGDGTTVSNKQSDMHTYTKEFADDKQSATITASFTARLEDGTTRTVNGPECVKKISFDKPVKPEQPTVPSTPVAAPTLPATGAGAVAGLFGASVIAGTMAFRRYLSRQ